MRRPRSLRSRVALIALLAVAAWVALITVAFNVLLNARLSAQADDILRTRAEATVTTLDVRADGTVSVNDTSDDAAIDVGTWIFAGSTVVESPRGNAGLEQRAAAMAGRGTRTEQTSGPDVVRLFALPVRAGGVQVATVVTSLSLAPYRKTEELTLIGSLLLAAVLLAGVFLALRASVARAMRPVTAMTEQASDWSAHDVERRFGHTDRPTELDALALTLDGLLDRLSAVLRHERQFSGELSHELRTPLARIIAETSLLRSRSRSPSELDLAHATIQDSAEQMSVILETLMSTARSQHGAPPGRCDAGSVVRGLCERVQSVSSAAAAPVVSVRVGAAPQMAGVDAAVLERILAPLMDNAMRYATRAVWVCVTSSRGAVGIEVTDDGPGIAALDLPHVFEPGRRVEHSDGHTGAGFGLALSRRLAVAAGGTVTAASDSIGASFQVTLPAG